MADALQLEKGHKALGRSFHLSGSLLPPLWIVGATSPGVPSSTNIPRLLVPILLSSSCCGCPSMKSPFQPLSPAFKHRVTLTSYAYGWKQLLGRSRQLISQVPCSAKRPTLNIYECTLNPSLDPFPGRGMKMNNFGL